MGEGFVATDDDRIVVGSGDAVVIPAGDGTPDRQQSARASLARHSGTSDFDGEAFTSTE